MTHYKFDDRILKTPEYARYSGHTFSISHAMPQDTSGQHVWVVCVSDPTVKVAGYVHKVNLVPVPVLA